MATTNADIGERIASLRAARKLTQAELATALGLEHKQVVSNLEKGDRALKAPELARLSELFHVSPLVILGLQPVTAPPFVLWRQPAADDVRVDEEARFIERCRRYAFLERLAHLEPSTLALRYELKPGQTTYEDVAGWAEQARKALGVGDMPAPGLQEVLEQRHGVKIFVTAVKGGSGATFRGEFGDAVLVNAGEAPGRRAFSVAHELFHLLTWESTPADGHVATPAATDRVEKLAENFAAAFVLPREALVQRMPRGKPAEWRMFEWVDLARQFGVSVPALAWRLVNMGKLQRQQAEQIIADPTRAGAGAQAACPNERSLPDRYVTLAFKAYLEGEISIGKLAELLETTVGMLRKVLRAYGFDMDSDVWQAEAIPS
jgi:Zn-dependent peptidase ImmA (M78 family)/DNA-binding XRE family transcriptional regulator